MKTILLKLEEKEAINALSYVIVPDKYRPCLICLDCGFNQSLESQSLNEPTKKLMQDALEKIEKCQYCNSEYLILFTMRKK